MGFILKLELFVQRKIFIVLTATMMKLVLIVLFSGIVLMDTVSGAPPIAPNCECNGNIQYDRNNDQNVGECLTSINGQFFCYVSPSSGCSDMKWSSRSTPDNELWYSFDACLGPKAEMSDTDGWPELEWSDGEDVGGWPPLPFEPIAPTISDCDCDSIEVYHYDPLEYTHTSIYGYYVRQEDLINERPWFKNNGKSIWWDTKYWRLGWTNRKGGERSHAKLYNNEICLTKTSDQEWNLYDGNNWSIAGDKLRIRCSYKPKGYGTYYCCSKMKLSLKGVALNEQGRLAGIYDRENELVNGRTLWRSQTDNDAIWFTKEMNYWSIGSYSDRGTNNGGIWSVTDASCPDPLHGYEGMLFFHHNGHATSGNYTLAPNNTISIECLPEW